MNTVRIREIQTLPFLHAVRHTDKLDWASSFQGSLLQKVKIIPLRSLLLFIIPLGLASPALLGASII